MKNSDILKFLYKNAKQFNLTFSNFKLNYSGPTTNEIKDFFSTIETNDQISHLISNYPNESHDKYEFTITYPRFNDGYLFKDTTNLIDIIFSRTADLPYIFAIHDEDILIENANELDSHLKIKAIFEFHTLLEVLYQSDIIDIFEPEKFEIRLGDKKIIANMKSCVTKQAFLNPEELISSINLIKSELDKNDNYSKEKRLILKKTLINFLDAVSPLDSINHLAIHIKDFTSRFNHNLELFITKFNFDDEEEKLLSELRAYQINLSSTLSTIQTQLFAVPIAVTVFIAQIKYDPNTKYILLINGAILVASLMASTISCFLLRSQKVTAHKIKNEIDKKNHRIKMNVPLIYKSIESQFIDLNKSYERIKSTIVLINWINVVSFLLVLTLTTWFTLNANCWVGPCISNASQESGARGCNINMPIYNFHQ